MSVQTSASHFRRDNDSQVYLPRHNSTQSAKEAGTNPVRSVTYLAGLRGGASTIAGAKPQSYGGDADALPDGPSRFIVPRPGGMATGGSGTRRNSTGGEQYEPLSGTLAESKPTLQLTGALAVSRDSRAGKKGSGAAMDRAGEKPADRRPRVVALLFET